MNEIVNRFPLIGDTFITVMYLRQPRFTYSACVQFIKNKEEVHKFMQTENTRYIYLNKLDKTCFKHDMAYTSYKDWLKGQNLIEVWEIKRSKFVAI